jgi:hypothetical protein
VMDLETDQTRSTTRYHMARDARGQDPRWRPYPKSGVTNGSGTGSGYRHNAIVQRPTRACLSRGSQRMLSLIGESNVDSRDLVPKGARTMTGTRLVPGARAR